MSGDGTLRDRVLEAIRAGRLPDRSPERTWGGQGSGGYCAICGERVRPDQVELELEFVTDYEVRGRESYHVHVGCFSAWNSERQKLALKPGSMAATELSSAGGENRLAAHEREAPLNRERA